MSSAAEIVVAGFFGGVIGSFLNVVAWRVPRGESLVSPGSRCPECGSPVKPYDNVPVLSWLVLRGRCRNCGAPISPRYPVVELLTAVTFAFDGGELRFRLPSREAAARHLQSGAALSVEVDPARIHVLRDD